MRVRGYWFNGIRVDGVLEVRGGGGGSFTGN